MSDLKWKNIEELENQFIKIFDVKPIELEYPDNFEFIPEFTTDTYFNLLIILSNVRPIDFSHINSKDSLKEHILVYLIQFYETYSNEKDSFYTKQADDLKRIVQTMFNEESEVKCYLNC